MKRNPRSAIQVISVASIIVIVIALLVSGCAGPAPTSSATKAPAPATTTAAPATSSAPPASTTSAAASPTAKPSTSPTTVIGPAPGEKWPDAVSVGTPTASGGAYFTATALSTLIKKYLNVTAAPQALGGSTAVLNAMAADRMEFAYIASDAAIDAYYGRTDFVGKPIKDLQILFGGPISMYLLVVRADSGINSVADLKGKKVMYTRPGNPVLDTYMIGLLKAYNMTLKDINGLQWTSEDQIKSGLTAKTIDAALLPGPSIGQAPSILELSQTVPIHLVDIPADILQKVIDDNWAPGLFTVVDYKGGQYKGQDTDVHIPNQLQFVLVRKSLAESFGYQLLKTIWDDHLAEYESLYPNNKIHSAKNTINITALPFHAGTIKYFQEKGLWTAEKQQIQDKNLAQAGKGQ
jgi:uncharacterized protein